MKQGTFLVLCSVALLLTVPVFADTWENVSLVDGNCLSKVKDNPDGHPRACLIKCSGAGYGILTSDGTFLKFDSEGTSKALAALQASEKADHIRVNVKGTRSGDTLKVESIEIK